MNCKICGHESDLWGNSELLGKYNVKYYRCPECGFIQTETPYWLDEAYSSAIADADIGLLGRNFSLARRVSALLKTTFPDLNSFLDWGGGYGIFTRLMRDAGFRFEWYDKYCDNLFAKGFERKQEHYDLITAFELLEHLPDPLQDISVIMSACDNLICSTELLPEPAPKPGTWWYYSPKTGQHISFYTHRAMQIIAEKFGKYYSRYGSLHIFSGKPLSRRKIAFVCKFSLIVNKIYKRRSLLAEDYEAVTGSNLR